jgi:hypothetical protein
VVNQTGTQRRTDHDGRDGDELVVDLCRLLEILCLEGDLQAAAAHAERHRVHVDVVRARGTRFGLAIGRIKRPVPGDCRVDEGRWRMDVLEDGDVDRNLGPAPAADVGGERPVASEQRKRCG